jgi:hypothetical protein
MELRMVGKEEKGEAAVKIWTRNNSLGKKGKTMVLRTWWR